MIDYITPEERKFLTKEPLFKRIWIFLTTKQEF